MHDVPQRQHIGPTLRALRHEQGLTLADVAERAGISPAYLAVVEHGRSRPSFTVLAGIAEALGQTAGAFAELEGKLAKHNAETRRYLTNRGVGAAAIAAFLGLHVAHQKEFLRLVLRRQPAVERFPTTAGERAVANCGR